jgi:hypothetical protein
MYLGSAIETVGLHGRLLRELQAPTGKFTGFLHKLWLSKPKVKSMPSRDDFTPAEMMPVLPYIYMIDVLGSGADFQMRLFGTALVELIGRDYTGVKMSEMGEQEGWRRQVYTASFNAAVPVFFQFDLGDFGKRHMKTENVLLPLRDRNGEYTILLCASEVIDHDYASDDQ